MSDLPYAYLWAVGFIGLLLLTSRRGVGMVAMFVGHFILKTFGWEKEKVDRSGDLSTLVGLVVLGMLGLIFSMLSWAWWGR